VVVVVAPSLLTNVLAAIVEVESDDRGVTAESFLQELAKSKAEKAQAINPENFVALTEFFVFIMVINFGLTC